MSEMTDAAIHFEAVKISLNHTQDGAVVKLGLHPDEIPDSLLSDYVGSRYMVAMVRLDQHDQPVVPRDREKVERLKASCGALCRNFKFQTWLLEGTDMDINESNAVEVLRARLGIQSRSEFDDNWHARSAFEEMREEFQEWLKVSAH